MIGRTLGSLILDTEKVWLEIGRYPAKPHCLLIMAVTEDGPYSKLTVNLDDPLPKGGLIMGSNSWGEKWPLIAKQLLNTKWFEETGLSAKSGWCTYPIWKITGDGINRLLYLDPKFVEDLFPETAKKASS